MKYLSILMLLAVLTIARSEPGKRSSKADVEDNEFAEFEEFDEAEDTRPGSRQADKKPEPKILAEPAAESKPKPAAQAETGNDDDEAAVENEDDEFEHFQDEEEFEGFEGKGGVKAGSKSEKMPDLKITSVPLHLRTNWDSFYLEMLMLAGLGVYFLNFLAGKAKNQKLAQSWLNAHRALLEDNFTIVGDDGINTEVQSGVLMKESENIYSLWCSGRACVEGMLIELKLLKRQDLVNTISRLFRPAVDQIIIKVTMDELEMDSFVFALGTKKTCAKLQKDMNDLSLFCPDKKSGEKLGLPSNYQILSEIGEATTTLIDAKILAVINKLEGAVEYMHFSDQYSGLKNQEDTQPTKMPDTQKVLHFCFNVPKKGVNTPKEMEELRPLLQMVFHCIDKVKKIRLTKEAKTKADKNRQKVEETFLKASHSQRQEAAQVRREDKRRAEKEKMMAEEDPDKQRKMEEKDNRREMKKKQAKVKMMKMKS